MKRYMGVSAFRIFVSNTWFDHKKEHLMWNKKPVTEYDMAEWFSRNKWFLKNLYKEN